MKRKVQKKKKIQKREKKRKRSEKQIRKEIIGLQIKNAEARKNFWQK